MKNDGLALQYIQKQTPEMCMAALKQNGLALQFVEKQTPEICLEAVRQNGLALQFVKEQTLELLLEVLKRVRGVEGGPPKLVHINVRQIIDHVKSLQKIF